MKLLHIHKSPLARYKWRATFEHEGMHGAKTVFHTDFGASGYQDFTQNKDPERAVLYRLRHAKDLKTNNPTRAGYLSWYILWGGPNFDQNVRRYKNKFHL
jgi:hypothetical protein